VILTSGVAKSAFTWSGFLSNLAAFTTALAFLGALFSAGTAGLRRWRRFRRWSLFAPLRAATRSSPRSWRRRSNVGQRRKGDRDDKQLRFNNILVLRTEFGSVRKFRGVVKRLISENENDLAAGFLLADLLAEDADRSSASGDAAENRAEHQWARLAPVLLNVFTRAAKQRSAQLTARLLYPEDVRAYSALFGAMAQAVSQLAMSAPVAFEMYRPAVGGHLTSDRDAGFPSFVTALTGAVVLADAADSASRCAEQVLVWHSRRFHGAAPSGTVGAADLPRYEDTHSDGVGCSNWQDKKRRLGDFDQRVLHLRSVALAEATSENGLSIVLETSETCYGTTEEGSSGAGCKNVPAHIADALNGDPIYCRSAAEPVSDRQEIYDYRIARQRPDAGRVTLLTAQLALVTADDKLVLQKRTAGVRHDASVIGTSAGGVISLGGVTPSGDLDNAGWPDPAAAITREALEETGVELSPASCRPVCVYLLNARDRAGSNEVAAHTGQLGAAILYLARTSLTSRELVQTAKTKSDLARGSYEQAGLALCPANSPRELAHWIRQNAADLSMHAVISCSYASLVLFGRDQTKDALSEAFDDQPWWSIAPSAGSSQNRLIRDPRELMRGGCIADVGPKKWSSAWETLRPAAPS
jgi:8-oxo-dGTP pyrophosphatase MutT (NUDIX family)